MLCFRFSAEYPSDEWFSNDVTVDLPDLRLPKRYCSTCRLTPDAACAEIPEPVPPVVRELLEPYQVEIEGAGRLTRKLMDAFDAGDPALIEEANDQCERHCAISPSEYAVVEEKVRDLMGFPPGRLLLPRETVGTPVAYVERNPQVDLVLDATCEVLTERAADELAGSGLTGFLIRPLLVVGTVSEKLFTLVVTGDGGVPEIVSGDGELRQCPECGEWWRWGNPESRLRVRAVQDRWDGSDFFHLERKGWVFVTERAKCWLENCNFSMLPSFQPLEEISLGPTLPRHTDELPPGEPPPSPWM